jgi:transcription elongation factor SPT4
MEEVAGGAPQHVRYARRPNTLRGLRACKMCKLIKTLAQFQDEFCDNCWMHWADGEPAAEFARQKKRTRALDIAMEETTADFEGMVAMMRPGDSWVAKWLQMGA